MLLWHDRAMPADAADAAVPGYRPSQKVVHWLTVAAVTAQFVVGYNLDLDDGCDPPGEDRSGGDTSDAAEERLDRLEDACEARADGYDLLGGGSTSPSSTCRSASSCWRSGSSDRCGAATPVCRRGPSTSQRANVAWRGSSSAA